MAHSATPSPADKPSTADAWKIELKVIASTAATFAVSLILAILNAVQDNHALLGSVPSALQFVILVAIPSAVTFLGGFLAKHTPRGPAAS